MEYFLFDERDKRTGLNIANELARCKQTGYQEGINFISPQAAEQEFPMDEPMIPYIN